MAKKQVKPFELSDKAIALLKEKIVVRFSKAKSKLGTFDFDEINIRHLCDDLFEELEKDNEKMFLSLAQNAYKSFGEGQKPPTKSWLKKSILDRPDPVTFYVYMFEVDRKKERLIESLLANQKRTAAFDTSIKHWFNMTRQYCDIVEKEAVKKSYKDSGVKKVVWVTAEDEKVCEECEALDGKVFSIDAVPENPHWGCRCFLLPK